MTRRLPVLILVLAISAGGQAQERRAPTPKPPAPPAVPPTEAKPTVVIDVVLAEFPVGKDVGRPEFAGPAADVLARLEELGKAGSVRRVRLTAIEGREASYSAGSQTPLPTSATGSFGGRPTQRSFNYVDIGVKVKATPYVLAEGGVTVDLSISESKIRPPATPDDIASIDNDSLAAMVNVPAGRAIAAQEVWTDGKTGRTVNVIVIAARIAEGGK